MTAPETVLASNNSQDKGSGLYALEERYTKAALYVFALDRTVIPYVKGELRNRARWYSNREQWSKQAKGTIEMMICLLLYDVEKGGRTTAEFRSAAIPVIRTALRSRRSLAKRSTIKEKVELLGISRASWYRHYAKPYEALYADFMGWADIGLRHVRRMHNYID